MCLQNYLTMIYGNIFYLFIITDSKQELDALLIKNSAVTTKHNSKIGSVNNSRTMELENWSRRYLAEMTKQIKAHFQLGIHNCRLIYIPD